MLEKPVSLAESSVQSSQAGGNRNEGNSIQFAYEQSVKTRGIEDLSSVVRLKICL